MSLNRSLSELASSLDLRTVATNNVHYATKEDFQIHDILTCIRTLTKLEDGSSGKAAQLRKLPKIMG